MTQMLGATFNQAALGGLAAWHLVMVAAVFASPDRHWTIPVVVAHGAVVGGSLFGIARRMPAVWLLALNYGAAFLDLAAANDHTSALAYGAIWTVSVTAATPAFIMSRSQALLLGFSITVAAIAMQLVLHPGWPYEVRVVALVSAATLTWVAELVVAPMRRAAETADEAAQHEESARVRERVAQQAGRGIADGDRLLHDTLINTLGALANGRIATRDVSWVRDRCLQDLSDIDGVLDLDRHELEDAPASQIRTDNANKSDHPQRDTLSALIEARYPLAVEVDAPSMKSLKRFETLVPPAHLRAICGAVYEAIRNAEKHAGVDRVSLEIALSGPVLEVLVSDCGIGFHPDACDARGIKTSILQRCNEVGVAASIESAPGRGTRVSLSWELESAGQPDAAVPPQAPTAPVSSVFRSGCWAWAGCILASAVVTQILGVGAKAPLSWLAIVVSVVLCGISWRCCRNRLALPWWASALHCIGIPAIFALSFAAVQSGEVPLVAAYGILLAPPLVVLLVMAHSRIWLWITLTTLTAVTGLFALSSDGGWALVPVVAVGPHLALFACWLVMLPTLADITRRESQARNEAVELAIANATRNTVMASRRRWIVAGVRDSADLLRQVADGTVDVGNPALRRRCGISEAHLRAMLTIDPDLVHIGPWLASAITRARSRNIEVNVRGGAIDVPDAGAAVEMGRLLLGAVARCPRGSSLVIGVFGTPQNPYYTFVGPAALADVVGKPAELHRIRVDWGVRGSHWLAQAQLRTADDAAFPGSSGAAPKNNSAALVPPRGKYQSRSIAII
ncbi:sensor histidine kinase [Cumulibacter soli]|uniref:sensor histidine kinase n=1 Tax=Cumulibacter soli TaxID=2546344 RepID=UPI001067E743|nr:hypothetical protein [Cumulibacter soli]